MYIIGIDGGGTKTDAALADKDGKILSEKRGGSSNLRNVGIAASAETVFALIKEIKGEKDIACIYIALAAIEEEYKEKKDDFRERLREKGLTEKIVIGSDQRAAFRAGTNKKDGVGVICGTGAVAFGFRGEKEEKASGWGYLSDEGAAFYTGIEGYRALQKSFDGRGKKTMLEKFVLQEWGVGGPEELNSMVYKDFMKKIPELSVMVNKAGKEGDAVAVSILEKSGREAALAAGTVIKKLTFKENFPLILSGGMFNSKVLFSSFQKNIKSFSKKAEIKLLEENPVKGAVKLALENIEK